MIPFNEWFVFFYISWCASGVLSVGTLFFACYFVLKSIFQMKKFNAIFPAKTETFSFGRYDRTTKVMQDFKPAIAQLTNQTTLPSFMKYDIPQNVFFDMLIDKEGLLWLSSATNGIIKVRFPSNHFSFIYSSLLANDINATENSSGSTTIQYLHSFIF